jgi:folate-binding protein YgfZ
VPDRPYAVDMARDVLTVAGPDADAYLQGQLSQDVVALGAGQSAWSWLLAPTGKVDALVRVTRTPDGDWLIDTDRGWGSAVQVRLDRFKLRSKIEIGSSSLAVIGVRGPVGDLDLDAAGLVISPPWPGVPGADVIGTSPEFPGLLHLDAGSAEAEAERILAGIPKMGAELDERTIPGETGLVALTVSFTKGCYTGQELVARIDSRGGNVPRHLRGLRFTGGVSAGAELTASGDRTAGVVTSVARDSSDQWVGLGYVRRGFDPSEALMAGDVGATQVELSL